MLRAAIDLGTNSCLLTIADVENSAILQVHEDTMRIVRLGQDIDRTGELHPDAQARTLQALHEYKDICTKHGIHAQDVAICATSAMRDASNSADFVAQVQQETGLHIQVISGEEEARITWNGALTQLKLPEGATPCLLDIGGGSTELVWNQGQERWSMQMGSVRATERYVHDDPPTPQMLQAIRKDLSDQLQQLPQIPAPAPLIAVAGTATTLLAIVHQVEPYDSSKIHGKPFQRAELLHLIELFGSMTSDQRRNLPGLHPKRADVITAGAQILLTVYEHLNLNEAIISDRGLRYGLLLEP
ncbi:MAG: Ppx/GppA family phosphatase [Deltaproteobacteria bacterium]|nr:MAG: Ppx/GppA family phosphatase [Deltaproteobacteria bacterium]